MTLAPFLHPLDAGRPDAEPPRGPPDVERLRDPLDAERPRDPLDAERPQDPLAVERLAAEQPQNPQGVASFRKFGTLVVRLGRSR